VSTETVSASFAAYILEMQYLRDHSHSYELRESYLLVCIKSFIMLALFLYIWFCVHFWLLIQLHWGAFDMSNKYYLLNSIDCDSVTNAHGILKTEH